MKSIFTIILLLITTFGLLSEEDINSHRVEIGTNFGLNLNTSDFKNLGESRTCCEGFSSGFGTGLNFRLGYGYRVSDDLWLTIGADYNNLSSDFVELQSEAISLDGTNKLQGEIEQKVVAELSSIGIQLAAAYNLFGNLDANFGYKMSIPSELSFHQTEILVSPKNAVFQETQSKIRTDESGTLETNVFHSLIAGIGYKVGISKDNSTYLRPNINFNIGLNNISDEMNLKSNTINFGLDLAYSFDFDNSKENKEIKKTDESKGLGDNFGDSSLDLAYNDLNNTLQEPIVEETKIIIKPVSINKSGKRQDVVNIELEQVKSIRMVPLLNYIFFEKDSSSLPLRYSFLKKNEKVLFDVDNLFEQNTIDIYHHLLNILGSRMSKNPEFSLKIIGTKSEVETGALAKILPVERAKTVRDYLVNTWGIESSRLTIESVDAPYIPSSNKEEESIEENQRVELYSSTLELLSPLLLSDTLYTPLTKEVIFYMVVDTNLKSFSWKFEIYDSENNILFDNNGQEAPPLSTSFLITEELATKIKDDREIYYRYEIIKENQDRESVTGKINIRVNSLEEKERMKLKDRRIDNYSLILFDFDKYELNKRNMDILETIKKNITNESRLYISGYSDKIGSDEYNKELSKKRTQSVASQFKKAANIEQFPYGESIILFNNNIPEGRFYSRTVQIKAITPIR